MDPLPTRVDRGARFLDGYRPAWHDEVDPEKLGTAPFVSSVLGQLFGCITKAPDIPEFQSHGGGAERHGFFAWLGVEGSAEFNEAWRGEIMKRRQPR